MSFQQLENGDQLKEIANARGSNIIFKHNTTCPISKSVIKRLEQEADLLPENTPVYILDLLEKRDLSNSIAETFKVTHESPQILLIKDGRCIYNESLYNISAEETTQALNQGS